jgi:hypothetical protein
MLEFFYDQWNETVFDVGIGAVVWLVALALPFRALSARKEIGWDILGYFGSAFFGLLIIITLEEPILDWAIPKADSWLASYETLPWWITLAGYCSSPIRLPEPWRCCIPFFRLLINITFIPIYGSLSRGSSSACSLLRGYTSSITVATEIIATAITASSLRFGIIFSGHTRIRTRFQRTSRWGSIMRSAIGALF